MTFNEVSIISCVIITPFVVNLSTISHILDMYTLWCRSTWIVRRIQQLHIHIGIIVITQ